MREYAHRSRGLRDLRQSWRARQFIVQVYVGSSLGMPNYLARFMRTVEHVDDAGFYVPYFRLPPRFAYPW